MGYKKGKGYSEVLLPPGNPRRVLPPLLFPLEARAVELRTPTEEQRMAVSPLTLL